MHASTVTRTYLRYRGSWRRAGAGRRYNCCDCRYLEYINLMLLSRQLTDDIGEAGAAPSPSAGRYLYLSQLGATLSCLIIQRNARCGTTRLVPCLSLPPVLAPAHTSSLPCPSKSHCCIMNVHSVLRSCLSATRYVVPNSGNPELF